MQQETANADVCKLGFTSQSGSNLFLVWQDISSHDYLHFVGNVCCWLKLHCAGCCFSQSPISGADGGNGWCVPACVRQWTVSVWTLRLVDSDAWTAQALLRDMLKWNMYFFPFLTLYSCVKCPVCKKVDFWVSFPSLRNTEARVGSRLDLQWGTENYRSNFFTNWTFNYFATDVMFSPPPISWHIGLSVWFVSVWIWMKLSHGIIHGSWWE